MANHRHHQASIGLGGQPQMHRAKAGHHGGIVVITRIHLRMLAHRQHHGADQQRQQGQPATAVAMLRIELGAQGLKLGDIDFFDISEVGNAALGLLHLLRNFAAQTHHGNRFLFLNRAVTLVLTA